GLSLVLLATRLRRLLRTLVAREPALIADPVLLIPVGLGNRVHQLLDRLSSLSLALQGLGDILLDALEDLVSESIDGPAVVIQVCVKQIVDHHAREHVCSVIVHLGDDLVSRVSCSLVVVAHVSLLDSLLPTGIPASGNTLVRVVQSSDYEEDTS